MIRKQFPIIPMLAGTIDSAQSASYERVTLKATVPVFAHGHLYVALSRCKQLKHLRLLIQPGTTRIKNVVNRAVFPLHAAVQKGY